LKKRSHFAVSTDKLMRFSLLLRVALFFLMRFHVNFVHFDAKSTKYELVTEMMSKIAIFKDLL